MTTPLCPHCAALAEELKTLRLRIQKLEDWRVSHLTAMYDEPIRPIY